MHRNKLVYAATPIAIVLALSGCAQQRAGSLPATPSLLQSTSARTGLAAAALPQKYKVDFPTPTSLDQGFAPSVVMLSPSRVLEEHTNEAVNAA